MTKISSRHIGCLTQRRRCPCGDDQCCIRVEAGEEEAQIDVPVPIESGPTHGPSHTYEVAVVEAPYLGQTFQTAEEAQEYYTNFARRNGFAIRTERSKGNPSHPMGVYKRELVCHRAGAYRPRKTVELKRQRNKKSSRCQCDAQMIIKKNISKGMSRWVVIQFSNVHNHELLDSDEVRHLPAYRNISTADRERILALAKVGYTVNLIIRALEMEKGLKSGQLTFTERDLRNFLQASKNINRENEGAELLKSCKAIKDRIPDFRYEFTVDADDKLEHICWSYPDSIRAFKVFGDAVVFDTTYRLYAYDRPVGVWFGMDNYGNAIFLGCVLLQDERPSSYKWALQSFVHIMDGKFPKTLVTDLDLGLKEAAMNELPGTKHVFSYWYIASRLSSWFSASLGPHFERFMVEFQATCSSDSLEEFTHRWGQLVSEFRLTSDRHVAILTYNQEYWALPFLRGWFLGRFVATDFSSSIKSFFKGSLNAQTRLRDFVEQIGAAAELQNQEGEEATMKQNYLNVKIKTCMPIEEHAATILTPYAFDLLQKELVSSTQLAVYETQSDTYLVHHRLQPAGGHIVQFIASDDSLCCSCKEFESSGILCQHALRVLSLKNCFSLPDKYLLVRWRRESSLFPKSTGYKYRSQALRSLASIIIQESSLSKERFDFVQWHMNKLLANVRDMPTIDEAGSNMETASSLDATVDITLVRPKGRPKKAKATVETPKESGIETQVLPEAQEMWENHELFGSHELS